MKKLSSRYLAYSKYVTVISFRQIIDDTFVVQYFNSKYDTTPSVVLSICIYFQWFGDTHKSYNYFLRIGVTLYFL